MPGAANLVIFISHRMDEVRRLSDKVSVLRNGELVETLGREEMTGGAAAAADGSGDAACRMRCAGTGEGRPVLHRPGAGGGPQAVERRRSMRARSSGWPGSKGRGRRTFLQVPRRARARHPPAGRGSASPAASRSRATPRPARWGRGLPAARPARDGHLPGAVGSRQLRAALDASGSRGWGSSTGGEQRESLARVRGLPVDPLPRHDGADHLAQRRQPAEGAAGAPGSRWSPRALLLDDPTRGVDLATRLKFYEAFRDLTARSGLALVVLSSEIEELVELCDRVMVFPRPRAAPARSIALR